MRVRKKKIVMKSLQYKDFIIKKQINILLEIAELNIIIL